MHKAIATARATTIIGAVPMAYIGALWLLLVILQSAGGTVPPDSSYSSFFLFPIAGVLAASICIPSGAAWLVLALIRLGREWQSSAELAGLIVIRGDCENPLGRCTVLPRYPVMWHIARPLHDPSGVVAARRCNDKDNRGAGFRSRHVRVQFREGFDAGVEAESHARDRWTSVASSVVLPARSDHRCSCEPTILP
jgi:hypothetical protein